MVELFSILLILIVNIFFRYSDFYLYVLHDTLITSINFLIVIRTLRYFYKNKMIFQKLRILIFSLLLTYISILSIFGISYFLGYFDNNIIVKYIIKYIVFTSVLTSFSTVKFYDFKVSKDYTFTYLFCNIIDTILVSYLIIIGTIISSESLTRYFYQVYLIIGIILVSSILKYYIEKKSDYWYHKKILYTKFYIIIKTKQIDKYLCSPLKRKVSEDYILKDCKYIMERSFIRSYSLNSISRKFYEMCLKYKLSHEKAIEYTSILCCMLMMNLMKRDLDFVIVPTFVINPIQLLYRNIKFWLVNKKKA